MQELDETRSAFFVVAFSTPPQKIKFSFLLQQPPLIAKNGSPLNGIGTYFFESVITESM